MVAVQNIRYDRQAEALYILDQSLLPNEEKEIRLETLEQMVEAIRACGSGRPAIGICAAYCMYVLARSIRTETAEGFLAELEQYEKPVILTFDDGYDDNYTELLPLLRKYNVKATVFMIADAWACSTK